MRDTLLLSFGAACFLCIANLGMNRPIAAVAEADAKASKESYVKVHVDVEARGILKVTDQGATLTARDRIYDLFNDQVELTDREIMTEYTLDFKRSGNLIERARSLSGLEVIVTGLSELRMVNQKRPGGAGGNQERPPTPTWSLQRTIMVNAVRPAN